MTPPPAERDLSFETSGQQQTVYLDNTTSLAFQNPVDGDLGGDNLEDRMCNLERAFVSFSQDSTDRISRIERNLEELISMIRQQQQRLTFSTALSVPSSEPCCGAVSSPCTNTSCSPVTSPHSSPLIHHSKGINSRLLLVNVEKKWYTKRPFPDFEVRMVSGDSDRLLQNTPNHQIRLRLLSGTGVYIDHFLNTPTLTFSLVNGKCTISGIRFSAVSSRNGGFFQFEVSLCSPQDTVVSAVRSIEIRVLSERLKNEPKADNISELHGNDSLVRVPGIGKKYAARFRELGLMSISDLAAVNESDDMGKRRRELLEAVRKDRGALTEAKLNDLIKDAQSVVERDDQHDSTFVQGATDYPDNGEDDDDDYHSSESDSDTHTASTFPSHFNTNAPVNYQQQQQQQQQHHQFPAVPVSRKHSHSGESSEPLAKKFKGEMQQHYQQMPVTSMPSVSHHQQFNSYPQQSMMPLLAPKSLSMDSSNVMTNSFNNGSSFAFHPEIPFCPEYNVETMLNLPLNHTADMYTPNQLSWF